MGLNPVPQTWMVLDTGWWSSGDDAVAYSVTRGIVADIKSEAKVAGAYQEYIFMNDASWDQDVITHYGSKNVARMKIVQEIYDTDHVFQRLVPGGFKLF